MDAARVYQVRALLFVEVLQIGDVLEVVGVKLAALDDVVRLHVILEFLDLERPALGSQDGSDLRENFGVRRGAGSNGDGALALDSVGSSFIGCRLGGCRFGRSGGFGLCSAGGERQAQNERQNQRKDFLIRFHLKHSFIAFRFDFIQSRTAPHNSARIAGEFCGVAPQI